MRLSTVALAALPAALAAPQLDLAGGSAELAGGLFKSAQSWLHDAISDVKHSTDVTQSEWMAALQTKPIVQHGIEYLSVEHPEFPLHRLRVVKPEICDSSVKQLSGYLDISETRHLFFWFQESRSKPKEDPLVLWLNGGPGCSSSTGLMMELGGCSINENANVSFNDNSWNNVANMIFLDQPIGVGYSYADEGEVSTSPAAAEDVYAFLMLFITQFKQYSELDFHVAGESYAGQYIPNIADVIYRNSAAAKLAPTPHMPILNFKSVLIGNGLTDPLVQHASVPEWACEGPYAVFDPAGSDCASMRGKVPRCQRLTEACYKSGSRLACVPAAIYCTTSMYGPIQNLGVNMYDVRKKCDRADDKDGPLCYRQMGWIERYLNKPDVKEELGVPAEMNFQACNNDINRNFLLQGDGTHYAGALLGPLLDSGIRVLIYSGEADSLVNFIGCSRVADNLQSRYTQDYAQAKTHNFTASDGSVSGWTKSTGEGAGNLAFVAFANAGHMVPLDDPVGALTMFDKWINDKSLV